MMEEAEWQIFPESKDKTMLWSGLKSNSSWPPDPAHHPNDKIFSLRDRASQQPIWVLKYCPLRKILLEIPEKDLINLKILLQHLKKTGLKKGKAQEPRRVLSQTFSIRIQLCEGREEVGLFVQLQKLRRSWQGAEYSTVAATLINSSTMGTLLSTVPQDSTLAHHTGRTCGLAREGRTLLATLVPGWWAAGRGASASWLWLCQGESMRGMEPPRTCFPLPHSIPAYARGTHRTVQRLRTGAM